MTLATIPFLEDLEVLKHYVQTLIKSWRRKRDKLSIEPTT